MGYIIFTLILFGYISFVQKDIAKNQMIEQKRTLLIFVMIFWFYYLHDYLLMIGGVHFPFEASIAMNMICNMLIPVGYIYVCQNSHVRLKSASTYGLFAVILLNFFYSGTIYLDKFNVADLNDSYGIHFYRKRKEFCTIPAYGLVEIIQTIWVSVRLIVLNSQLKEKSMRISKHAILAMISICTILITMNTFGFLPRETWTITGFQILYFTINLIAFCAFITMVSKGFLNSYIKDNNNETVYLETEPKYTTMRQKLDELMAKKNLYKNPNLCVELVAQKLNTNRTYLTEMMKEQYGTTFTNYINTLRIEEAKRLISSNESMKLEEVAMKSGFSNASTFTKTFKTITGTTPSNWKK